MAIFPKNFGQPINPSTLGQYSPAAGKFMLNNPINPSLLPGGVPGSEMGVFNPTEFSSTLTPQPGELGAEKFGLGGIEGGADAMSKASKLGTYGSIASSAFNILNKGIGTYLMLKEAEKNRRQERQEWDIQADLAKKSMILEYLLGNRDYRDKLEKLRIKMAASGRNRAKLQSSEAEQIASRKR